jgi:hypothetical protein
VITGLVKFKITIYAIFLRQLRQEADVEEKSLTFSVNLTFLAQTKIRGVIITVGASQTTTLNGLAGSSLGTTCCPKTAVMVAMVPPSM